MTPEQHRLANALVIESKDVPNISPEDFVRRFPSAVVDSKVAKSLFEDAESNNNAVDLASALVIGFNFGFDQRHVDILCRLIESEWHYSHEDIVCALCETGATGQMVVNALARATEIRPNYLDYDETRALATKAIWVLGKIGNKEASDVLSRLIRSKDKIINFEATVQLDRQDQKQSQ